MIRINLSIVEVPPASQKLVDKFDHIFDSNISMNLSGSNPKDGEVVSTILDIGKEGGKNMAYEGLSAPLLSKKPPIFRAQLGGYIQFYNQFNTIYVSDQFVNSKPFPRELFFVGNQAKFNTYEAIWNNYNSHYIGDYGDNQIRFRASIDEPPAGQPNAINTGFPIRQNYLLHVKYIQDGIGIKCQVRINKVLVNETVYTIPVDRIGKPTFSLGADTNTANFGACWQGWSFTEFTDAQRTEIENILYDRYNIGTRVQLPLAESLLAKKNGTTYTASYTYVNPLGFPEDVSARSVKWVLTAGGSIQTGKYYDAVEGLLSWNSTAYPIESGYDVSSVEIICVDTRGNKYYVPEKVFVTN